MAKGERWLVFAAYWVAFYLVVMPLWDVVAPVWPIQIGNATGRFGLVGQFSQALTVPLVGLALAISIAIARHGRRTLKALSLACLLGAGATLAVLPLYALDALELRAVIAQDLSTSFDIAAATAIVRMFSVVVLATVIGMGAWIASQQTGRSRGSSSSARGVVFR